MPGHCLSARSQPTRSITKAYLRSTALLACMWGCLGCVSLDDVTQLSKLADSAEQTFPAVVSDIPASCARQNVLVNDYPAEERPIIMVAQDCKPYQDVADHLTKDQSVLIAYFDALGKLASNTPPAYDQAIDTNVAAIAKIPTLSKNTVAASSAAQTIMKFLADEATANYRERKITSLVERTDPAIQELTADLKKVIVTDYAGILSNESAVLDIYYESPIAAAKPTERLSQVLVQRQYEGDRANLQSKLAATVAYGKAMDSLASLHSKLLTETKKKASLRDMATELGPDITNLKSAITQLQTELK
jgi:hypothetical protein